MRTMAYFCIAFILCVSMSAADYFDDFESYPVGTLLEDTGNWNHDDEGGHFLVADDAGDNVAESYFDDYPYAGYACEAGGSETDVAVEMDFEFDTGGCLVGLMVRGNIDTEEAYLVAIAPVYPPITAYFIYYVSSGGYEYVELDSGVGPNLSADTWHNIKVVASGSDPVNLKLYINGDLEAEYDDSTYLLAEGHTGFGSMFEGSEPVIRIDDYNMVAAAGAFNLLTPPDGDVIDVWPTRVLKAAEYRTGDPVDVDVEFTWEESTGADEYELLVDDNDDFDSPEVDAAGIADETYTHTFSVAPDTPRQYWRVIATNAFGDTLCDDDFYFDFNYNNTVVEPASIGRVKATYR